MEEPPIIYKIRSPATPGPNCLWRINRPDLGMVGEGYIFEVLVKNVAAYRKANGIPIGLTFELDLEQAVCAQHPDLCVTNDPREIIQPRALRLQDVLLGTRVMVSFLASGRVVVDASEAERRAEICAGCKFNVPYSKGCGGVLCGELKAVVERIVPHGTKYDEVLNACGICGCILQASVWLPLHLQYDPMSDHLKAQFKSSAPKLCWKKVQP